MGASLLGRFEKDRAQLKQLHADRRQALEDWIAAGFDTPEWHAAARRHDDADRAVLAMIDMPGCRPVLLAEISRQVVMEQAGLLRMATVPNGETW